MLEVQNLSVAYGAHRALEGVSISVKKGEICVILGSNGAGKTTLLKTIAGMVSSTPGSSIAKEEQNLVRRDAFKIVETGVALVPEGRGVFGDLSVIENLRLGAYARRARATEQKLLAEVFELFPKLKERQHQAVRTMSGGEQQMVAIGRALMSNPDILMLDEPSLGLSPKLCGELFSALKRVGETGVGILLVEQNAKQSLAIADRGYLLENGHITGEDSARNLMHDPAVQAAYLGGAAEAPSRQRDIARRAAAATIFIPAASDHAATLAMRAAAIQTAHLAARRRGGHGHGFGGQSGQIQAGGTDMVATSQLSARAAEFANRAAEITTAYVQARRKGGSGLTASDAVRDAHPSASTPAAAPASRDRSTLSGWAGELADRAAVIAAAHVMAKRGSARISAVPRMPEPPDTLIPVPWAQNENREAELAARASSAAAQYVAQRRASQTVPSAFSETLTVPGEKNVVAFRNAAFRSTDDDGTKPGGNRKKKKSS